MNHTVPTFEYIETPRGKSRPIKLDRILKRRMRTFLRARQSVIKMV